MRIYGYNNINFTQKLNATTSHSSRTEDYKVQNIIANILVSNGFNEMMANSLTTPSYVNLSENLSESNNVMMLNPLSSDLSAMRQSLLFSALEAVSFNINRRNSDLRLFEFGKTYHKLLSGHEEKAHLTLTMTGNRNVESWTNPQKPSDFFLFKGYVQAILERLGIKNTVVTALKSDVFTEGMTLEVGASTLLNLELLKNQF